MTTPRDEAVHRGSLDLKWVLVRRIILVAVLCVVGGAALVLRDVAVEARQYNEELASNVARQLTLQLHRIDAALDRPERFPDWGAIASSSLAVGQCVTFVRPGSGQPNSNCSGVDTRRQIAPQWFQRVFEILFVRDTTVHHALLHRGVTYGTVTTSIETSVIAERALQALSRMLGIWGAMISAMCVLVYIVVDRALRPTNEILAGLNRLADGNLSCRLPAFRLRELDRIAAVFNSLAERLQGTTRERTELARKLVDAQEQERQHIARELHDDVAQRLNALSCSAASIKSAVGEGDPVVMRESAELMAMASGTMRSLRETLTYLRPPEIDDLGLIPSLHALVRQHDSRSPQTKFSLVVDGNFQSVPPETAAHVYRIVQEGMNNAARHANARNVLVTLGSEAPSEHDRSLPRRITLAIVDDGVGARRDTLGDGALAGVGLLGMRERVHALNGEMTMGQGAGGGFELRISFPERDTAEAAA
jgi:two-component system sensor histidine kinase UhpB